MQTLILNHYPPVIKRIREMQQIAGAEDAEFSRLGASIKNVSGNMFVSTADETGVQRFEKILGIRPEAGQNMEERKLNVLFALNKRKMSLGELEGMLRGHSGGIELICNYAETELVVRIGENVNGTGVIFKILDDVLPLNIYIGFLMEITAEIKLNVTFNGLEMETTPDWWNGLALHNRNGAEMETTIVLAGISGSADLVADRSLWYLDGSVLLDGSRLLNAEIYGEGI